MFCCKCLFFFPSSLYIWKWLLISFTMTEAKWKSVVWSDKSKVELKRRGTIRLVISSQFTGMHLWWYDSSNVYTGFRATHAPIQTTPVSAKSFIFQQDNATMEALQQHGFIVEDLSPITIFPNILKCKIQQRRSCLAATILYQSVQQLLSSVPQILWTVAKIRCYYIYDVNWDATVR